MKRASGSQLAQSNITSTATPTLAFTATLTTEINTILVVNSGANSADVEIYHDDDGTTYTAATKVWIEALATKTTRLIQFEPGAGIVVSAGGKIAVEATGTTPDVTFTMYGTTEDIASNG